MFPATRRGMSNEGCVRIQTSLARIRGFLHAGDSPIPYRGGVAEALEAVDRAFLLAMA